VDRPERDRADAICQFCDTEFVGTDGPGGGKFLSPVALARAVRAVWTTSAPGRPLVVCTGGEPLLQLDAPLVEALHEEGFEVAVETNGTGRAGRAGLDSWPQAGAPLIRGHELKLVYPQGGAEPERSPISSFNTSSCSRWTVPSASGIRGWRSTIV
jgi:hypothetical protein